MDFIFLVSILGGMVAVSLIALTLVLMSLGKVDV